MKKYCIIGFNNRNMMPYMLLYENMLTNYGIDFDIFTWDRNGEHLDTLENEHCFRLKLKSSKKRDKFLAFMKWKKWILNKLEKENYESIIVLTTIPAFLLKDYLIKNYKKNFLFDIRDYTYENINLYKKSIVKVISMSKLTMISSKGFLQWLPNLDEITVIHNIPYDIHASEHLMNPFDKTINIGYLGGISYEEQNKKICEALKNNEKYHLHYIGTINQDCKIREFCEENNIRNVLFKGRFASSEKEQIYRSNRIQLINAVYGSHGNLVTTSLPNKLYDCVFYKIPILVSKNTFLAEVVHKYHLGVAIDTECDSISETIDSYIENFDEEKFIQGAQEFLTVCKKEQNITLKKIEMSICD